MSEIFSYHMPTEMAASISLEFSQQLRNALQEVFSESDSDAEILDFCTGTCGWNDALKRACEECGRADLYGYADGLEWYDWDIFSYELTKKCLAQAKGEGQNDIMPR